MTRAARWTVLVATVLAAGMVAGAALAQAWQRPGDEVETLADADRALQWWRGGANNQASADPRSFQEANDRLWLAFGQIADDMMELDLRTRSPLYRRTEEATMQGVEEARGLRVFCDPGDVAVAGGWFVDPPQRGGEVFVAGSFPATVALGLDHTWDVSFVTASPPLAQPVRVAAHATCWDLAG